MKTFTVRKSKQADAELRSIWRSIAGDNIKAADKVLMRLHHRLQELSHFPKLGPVRPDLRPGCRVFVEGNYIVLYKLEPQKSIVRIVAVIDARRDLTSL